MLTSFLCVIMLCQPSLAEAGGGWGTTTQAKQLFREYRSEFNEIYRLLNENQMIPDVSPGDDLSESAKFFPEYQGWAPETYKAYSIVLAKIETIGLERVRVERFEDRFGNHVEHVDFVVFGRGFGSETEMIAISRVKSDNDRREPEKLGDCQQLEKFWFVCHTK